MRLLRGFWILRLEGVGLLVRGGSMVLWGRCEGFVSSYAGLVCEGIFFLDYVYIALLR